MIKSVLLFLFAILFQNLAFSLDSTHFTINRISAPYFIVDGNSPSTVTRSYVGFEVINKIPPTLHTPLMSGSNAISGISVIGAILAAGEKNTNLSVILGLIAVILAMVNVVGGFLVTDRMLQMFKKKEVKA